MFMEALTFNLAFGVGGFTSLTVSLLVVCLLLSATFTGERPLLQRVLGLFLK